jgi:hypothetical protein
VPYFRWHYDLSGLGHRDCEIDHKKSGKSYAALVIQPIQNEGKTLKIVVVVYWISYKEGHLKLGLSDWTNVQFHYDCDKQQFIVSSVKLGGI